MCRDYPQEASQLCMVGYSSALFLVTFFLLQSETVTSFKHRSAQRLLPQRSTTKAHSISRLQIPQSSFHHIGRMSTQPFRSNSYLILATVAYLTKLVFVDPFLYIYSLLKGPNKVSKSYYNGKTVLITGASSGIGKSLALTLAELDANIILTSRDEAKLNAVAYQCAIINPKGRYHVGVLDMESYEKITTQALEEILKTFNIDKIDVLLLNAGVSARGSVVDTSMPTYEKLMAINFFGPVALTKAALPLLSTRASIGVVSTVQGKIGLSLRSSYAASKHAVQGFFDSLRAEVAEQGISVTIASPGYVSTSLSLNALNGNGTKYNKMDETTANGMSPSYFSIRFLEAVAKGTADIVIADAKAMLGIFLGTTFPQILAKILKKK